MTRRSPNWHEMNGWKENLPFRATWWGREARVTPSGQHKMLPTSLPQNRALRACFPTCWYIHNSAECFWGQQMLFGWISSCPPALYGLFIGCGLNEIGIKRSHSTNNPHKIATLGISEILFISVLLRKNYYMLLKGFFPRFHIPPQKRCVTQL